LIKKQSNLACTLFVFGELCYEGHQMMFWSTDIWCPFLLMATKYSRHDRTIIPCNLNYCTIILLPRPKTTSNCPHKRNYGLISSFLCHSLNL